MIIELYSLFKSLSLVKSTHKEYRDFKRHTRILPSGKLVSVAEYHRLMDVKGEEDNDDGRETTGNKGISKEKGTVNRESGPGIHSDAFAEELIKDWRQTTTIFEKENGVDVSTFIQRVIRDVNFFIKSWPWSALKYLRNRLANKKPFIVFKTKENIPLSILPIYEKSKGICLDENQIDVVYGIHQGMSEETLRHETTHLLMGSIYQEVRKTKIHNNAFNCSSIIDPFIEKSIKNIQNIVEFCSNKEWHEGIDTSDKEMFYGLSKAVRRVQIELMITEISHRDADYDETDDLERHLCDADFNLHTSFGIIATHIKIDMPSLDRGIIVILWHNWVAKKYKSHIPESYIVDEPISHACGTDREMFEQIFNAARKDFPELFTIDEVKKSLHLRI